MAAAPRPGGSGGLSGPVELALRSRLAGLPAAAAGRASRAPFGEGDERGSRDRRADHHQAAAPPAAPAPSAARRAAAAGAAPRAGSPGGGDLPSGADDR